MKTTDNRQKKKLHALLSIITMVVGVILMSFKIAVDSEPGAIPLLLIIVGSGWFILSRIDKRILNK